MPKSRVRKKAVYTPPQRSQRAKASPRWLAPVMVTCWVIGILWIATYYVTTGNMPLLNKLGDWNMLIGFGFLVLGIILATRWR